MGLFDESGQSKTPAAGPRISRRLGVIAEAIGSRCSQGLFAARKDKPAVLRALADWQILADVGARHGIDPRLVAAVGVRESAYRNIAQPNGMGRGVFQIDIGRNPSVSQAEAMNVAWAADWAAQRISSNFKHFLNRFPYFTKEQALQAALAA